MFLRLLLGRVTLAATGVTRPVVEHPTKLRIGASPSFSEMADALAILGQMLWRLRFGATMEVNRLQVNAGAAALVEWPDF